MANEFQIKNGLVVDGSISGSSGIFTSNVGIGTPISSYILDISGSVKIKAGDENTLYLDSTTGESAIMWLNSGGNKWQQRVGEYFSLYNYTANRWAFSIDGPNARVGINTYSPTTKLHISGSSTAEGLLYIQNNSGTSVMYITSSGNVGIGTIVPEATLDVYSSAGKEFTVYDGYYRYNIGSDAKTISGPNNNLFSIWKNSSDTYFNSSVGGYLFRVDDIELARIDRTGKVGIGVSSPTTKLHISGSTASEGLLNIQNSSGTNIMYVSSSGDIGIANSIPKVKLHINGSPALNATSTQTLIRLERPYNSGVSWAQGVDLALGRGISYPSSQLRFLLDNGTNNPTNPQAMIMSLDSSGKVGINTTAPSYNLEILGSDGFRITSGSGAGGINIIPYKTGHTYHEIKSDGGNEDIVISPGSTERVRFVQSTGYVGIGTSSPSQILHLERDNADVGIAFTETGGSVWHVGMDYSNSNVLSIGNSSTIGTNPVMTLNTNGTVGIGTASPSTKLDVIGTTKTEVLQATSSAMAVNLSGNGYIGWGGSNTSIAGAASSNMTFKTGNGNARMFISSSGNVGINTVTPTQLLDVNGNVTANWYLYNSSTKHSKIILGNFYTDSKKNLVFNNQFTELENLSTGTIKILARKWDTNYDPNGIVEKIFSFTVLNGAVSQLESQVLMATSTMKYFRIGEPFIDTDSYLKIPIHTTAMGSGRGVYVEVTVEGSSTWVTKLSNFSFDTEVEDQFPGLMYNTFPFRVGIGLGNNVMPKTSLDVNGNVLVTGSITASAGMSVGTNTVLHAGNYNGYTPTLTGGSASGTWNINITGSSSYATTATSATSASFATSASVLAYPRTINGTSFNGSANITITSNTPNSVTFNNGGAGAASGTTFNGGSAVTVSYNTIGAAASSHTHTAAQLTGITQGYIPFGKAASGLGSTANLFWDETNARLGVGISAPTSRLHISASIASQPLLNIQNISGTSLAYVSSSGNVGLGTITPNGVLHVKTASSTPILILEDTGASSNVDIRFIPSTTANTFTLGIDDSDLDKFKLSFGTALGTNDLITVTGSGNVGIGTSSPSAKLDIVGSFENGNAVSAPGGNSHAEGNASTSIGQYSHAEGEYTTSVGYISHVEGYYSTSVGTYSHAEGNNTISVGQYSHAEGQQNTSIGNYSHAEGYSTTSVGPYSHAEGNGAIASGSYSHAEGWGSKTVGQGSHAEGLYSTSIGTYSHSEGQYATSVGYASHAEGRLSTATNYSEYAYSSNNRGQFSRIGLWGSTYGATSTTLECADDGVNIYSVYLQQYHTSYFKITLVGAGWTSNNSVVMIIDGAVAIPTTYSSAVLLNYNTSVSHDTTTNFTPSNITCTVSTTNGKLSINVIGVNDDDFNWYGNLEITIASHNNLT